jgi:YbbR domain-containing protein
MESVIAQFFLHNWQRKLVAALAAIVIWLFVNHSISETVTIPNIPIRIINLPSDKTIQGLLPNGILSRRITLNLTGSKDVVEQLEPGDIEVLLDASTADNEDWIVYLSKKNLVSLNPSIDLSHISLIEHNEFVVKLSKLMTAKIPLRIESPKGSSPPGYEYLDIWPQHLTQTISGPEEDIQKLKEKGLEISYDLADITRADLDAIKSNTRNDEISFPIPKKWKQIVIPFRPHTSEEINDPEAQHLRIDFLRKDILQLDKEIPVRVFYPLDDLDKLNPEIFSIATNDDIQKREGVAIFSKPLYASEVSRLFLDVVRNSLEIVIIAAPKTQRKVLAWSIQFIQPRDLEDTYVAFSIANATTNKGVQEVISKAQEELLRKRFRDYMQRMNLYIANNKKLHLKSTIEGDQIRVVAY